MPSGRCRHLTCALNTIMSHWPTDALPTPTAATCAVNDGTGTGDARFKCDRACCRTACKAAPRRSASVGPSVSGGLRARQQNPHSIFPPSGKHSGSRELKASISRVCCRLHRRHRRRHRRRRRRCVHVPRIMGKFINSHLVVSAIPVRKVRPTACRPTAVDPVCVCVCETATFALRGRMWR